MEIERKGLYFFSITEKEELWLLECFRENKITSIETTNFTKYRVYKHLNLT